MTSPIRTSKVSRLDQLDPETTWKKLRGTDQSLKTPPSSRPRSPASGGPGKSRKAWAGSARYAAELSRLETNRFLRDLKSRYWQDRQNACEYLGEKLGRQNYQGLARLADLICTEKDSNVLDSALEAMLKINGHFHAPGFNDAPSRGRQSPAAPAQSSAGLPTPVTTASSPMHSPAKVLSPAKTRPSSGVRPTSAASRVQPPIDEEAEMSAGNLAATVHGVGARPLAQLRSFDADRQEGGGTGGVSRRPASASAGAISWGIDGGDNQAMSPLISPLMHELSRRRQFSQRTARAVGGGDSSPYDSLSSPLSRNGMGGGSLLDSHALVSPLRDGSPLRGSLRPKSAPAFRLKGLMKKHTALHSVAKTIGAGRTDYDEDSYNNQSAPSAETAILSLAIDKFAAAMAIDRTIRHGIKQILWDLDLHGGSESSRNLCARFVEAGCHGLWMDEELVKLLIAMTSADQCVQKVRHAAYLLGIVAQADDATAVSALTSLLTNKDEIVKERAALSLGPLDRATNSRFALESLCVQVSTDWQEDFLKAAYTSIVKLSEWNFDLAVETLILGSKHDSTQVSAVAAEGLIALASSLNLKIDVEERRLAENRRMLALDQDAFEASSKQLADVETATLEMIEYLEEKNAKLHKWSTTTAIHPAVNMCRQHYLTADFLRESLDILNILISSFRVLEEKSYILKLSDMYQEIATRNLKQLKDFKQSPDAHESMHAMLSTLVLTIVKSDTAATFVAIHSDLDVHIGRLQRQTDRLFETFEGSKQVAADNEEYLNCLKKCRDQVLLCMSDCHHLSSSVRQAIFYVFEQLGEHELLMKAAVKALVEGSDTGLHRVARSMILDAVDQLDELEEQEHVLTDTLEDTFELLRQQYYESTSLGDGYDFSRVSSGLGRPAFAKNNQGSDDKVPQIDEPVHKAHEGQKGQDQDVGKQIELDNKVRDLMSSLIDIINISMSSNMSGKTKCAVWALVCSHIDSGAWPLGQVACVSLANWGGTHPDFKCSLVVMSALCDKIFHTQKPVRNAAIEALRSVQLVSSSAVRMLSRIIALSARHGHRLSATRAITALISRGEETGGIPRSTGMGYQAAHKWLSSVEQSGEFQQLRLAAREGLYALQGKSFSYEREAQMERAVEKDLEMQRKKAADTQEKSDPAVRCGVGDIVEFHGLLNAQSKYNDERGEITALEGGPFDRISEVWVKLPDEVRRLPIKVKLSSLTIIAKGLVIGDYVQLHSLPKFQSKYTDMTGVCMEVIRDTHQRVAKVRVKLPDQIRALPLLVPKASVTLVAKEVRAKDKVILKFLPPDLVKFDGIQGHVIRKIKIKGHVQQVEVQLPEGMSQDIVQCEAACVLPLMFLLDRKDDEYSSRIRGNMRLKAIVSMVKGRRQDYEVVNHAILSADEDVEAVWEVLQDLLSRVEENADALSSARSRSTSVSFEQYAEMVLEKHIASAPQTPRAPDSEFAARHDEMPSIDESEGEDFWSFVSSKTAMRYGASTVRISGLLLHSKEATKPYMGIIGDYQRSERICNGKAVYLHNSKPCALWWTNIEGESSWSIGPADKVGSNSIWAYVKTDGLGPEHAGKKPWFVYSYRSQAYELQAGVEVVNLDTPRRMELANAWWSQVHDRAEEDPERLAAASNLANSLDSQGKHAEAEEMQREVLAVRKRVLGAEHPDTLTTASNLASSLARQGKHAVAEEMQREVLAVRKRVLGAEHPGTLTTASNLASSLSRQGKYAEAEEMECEVLAVRKRVLGAEHPGTLTSANNLATSLSGQGQHAEAEEMEREVLDDENAWLEVWHVLQEMIDKLECGAVTRTEKEAEERTLRALPSVISWWVFKPSLSKFSIHSQNWDGEGIDELEEQDHELFVIEEEDSISRPPSASSMHLRGQKVERPTLPAAHQTSGPQAEDCDDPDVGTQIFELEMQFRDCCDALFAGTDIVEHRKRLVSLKAEASHLGRMLDDLAVAHAAELFRCSLEERRAQEEEAAEDESDVRFPDEFKSSRRRPPVLSEVQVHNTEELHEALAQLVGEMREMLDLLPSPHARPLSADIASAESPMVAAIREEVRKQSRPSSATVAQQENAELNLGSLRGSLAAHVADLSRHEGEGDAHFQGEESENGRESIPPREERQSKKVLNEKLASNYFREKVRARRERKSRDRL